MSDVSSLRKQLKNTDLAAPSIQGAAGAMMKQYDKSPGLAVAEWRNALHQAREDQYLPLLYIANEVLQNSKRNRGNKFLEAFSPILGQALIFMSQRSSASGVDKIRRTVKIWGDRHVFSVRFVNELLRGLEPYRNGGNKIGGGGAGSSAPSQSPMASSSPAAISTASATEANTTNQRTDSFDREMEFDSSNIDDDNEDEEEDLFGNASSKLLKIDIDLDQAAAAANTSNKRRRSDASATGLASSTSGSHAPTKSKRRTVLTTSSLMELWNQVANLQMSYDRVLGALKEIDNPQILDEDAIQDLVGDDLLKAYKKTIHNEGLVVKYRKELFEIAQKRKALELEAVKYLPWLENALKQDEEDIQFCDKFLGQLQLFQHVHLPAKEARDRRLKEEEQRRIQEAELQKKKEEEEDRKKFMETAMAKQTEAQPGMVWNKATGEYQYLNQDESWRD